MSNGGFGMGRDKMNGAKAYQHLAKLRPRQHRHLQHRLLPHHHSARYTHQPSTRHWPRDRPLP
jgi:hypothetical protein